MNNRNPINDADGGVIISILMKKGVDYGQVLKIRRQQMNRYKANNNGFGGNGTNWFGK